MQPKFDRSASPPTIQSTTKYLARHYPTTAKMNGSLRLASATTSTTDLLKRNFFSLPPLQKLNKIIKVPLAPALQRNPVGKNLRGPPESSENLRRVASFPGKTPRIVARSQLRARSRL